MPSLFRRGKGSSAQPLNLAQSLNSATQPVTSTQPVYSVCNETSCLMWQTLLVLALLSIVLIIWNTGFLQGQLKQCNDVAAANEENEDN